MDVAVSGLFLALGLVLGGLAVFLLYARPQLARLAQATEEVAALKSQAETQQREREGLIASLAKAEADAARVPVLTAEVDKLRSDLELSSTHRASLESTLAAEQRSHAARQEELQRMGEELRNRFTVLAGEVLGKNSEVFLQLVTERFQHHSTEAEQRLVQREKAVESLVKPLTETLAKFESRVGEIEKAREGAYGAIQEQIRAIGEGQVALRTETARLVQALRSPKTRGRWGEMQLRNVLELAGMTHNVDFVEQSTLSGDDGVLRPDAVIRLPGGKSIVVDAKTPLEAYLNAVEADEGNRAAYLDQHAKLLRQHAKSLGDKEYWRRLADTPDFVVMFVPGEAFFAAAIESDKTVFEQAMRERVIIATPMTLLALVRVVAYGWQQERLAKNAQDVASYGRELYERLKVFGGHFGGLEKALRKTIETYNESVGSLEGRVLPSARRFEALGVVSANEALPEVRQLTVEPRRLNAPELVAQDGAGP